MGYLDGFAITIRQHRLFGGKQVTTEYSGGRYAKKHGAPNDPTVDDDEKIAKPERLHGRHVLNRYEDGMEKCIGCELCAGVCPAKCIYVRGADNDPEQPHVARRALRFRLRDQLPPVHPLRPVRRGVPDRGDHRDRSCSSSASPTARTRSTPRTSSSSTTRASRSSCRGRTGATARTSTPPGGCARRRRRATRRSAAVVGWSNELGHGERAPEPPQDEADADELARLRPRVGDGARRRRRRHRAAPTRARRARRSCSRCSASPCTSSRWARTSSPRCR